LNTPVPEVDENTVADILDDHEASGRATNAAEQDEIIETIVTHAADMQFRGQTHLIRVRLPSARVRREQLQALFEEAYFARFQVRLPEVRAMLVNLATSVIGRRPPLSLAGIADQADSSLVSPTSGDWTGAAVYDRASLPSDGRICGPAVIRQMDATTWIEPGAAATVDSVGNLRITVGAAP